MLRRSTVDLAGDYAEWLCKPVVDSWLRKHRLNFWRTVLHGFAYVIRQPMT
jgi:hypothetical protein